MKKTFCDRCNTETEEVKRSEYVIEDYEKSDGSGKGPTLVLDILIENFEDRDKKPEFCKPCFEEIIMELLVAKAKKPEKPKAATTSIEEDIPF